MKRIFIAVLVLAFIVGTVGLGVHLLNKKALAGNYQIHVRIWDVQEQEWGDGATRRVDFTFDGGDPTEKTTDGNGDAYMWGDPVINWGAAMAVGQWDYWDNEDFDNNLEPPVEAPVATSLITLYVVPGQGR